MPGDLNETIARLCVLDDRVRRAAYLAVRAADRPLTRAEVADEVGISARLAAFHLEKLVAEGLLETTYARGDEPAAVGHPSKRYQPVDLDLEVSIPSRRYDLAAEILAAAVDRGSSHPPAATLVEVAGDYGRGVGQGATAHNGDTPLVTALRDLGYEPASSDDEEVVLRNCPFRAVARALPEIICRMNVAFIDGVIDGTRSRPLEAVLAPATGRCCVVVR